MSNLLHFEFETAVPHISPSFGEMWEFTHAGARVPVEPEKFRFKSS